MELEISEEGPGLARRREGLILATMSQPPCSKRRKTQTQQAPRGGVSGPVAQRAAQVGDGLPGRRADSRCADRRLSDLLARRQILTRFGATGRPLQAPTRAADGSLECVAVSMTVIPEGGVRGESEDRPVKWLGLELDLRVAGQALDRRQLPADDAPLHSGERDSLLPCDGASDEKLSTGRRSSGSDEQPPVKSGRVGSAAVQRVGRSLDLSIEDQFGSRRRERE